MRNFEIACLMAVSPLFFSTLASSATSHYFRKFISSFLSVIAQVLWMGIAYSLATNLISDITSNTGPTDIFNSAVYAWDLVLVTIILFAVSDMISKPSNELKNLLS